MKKSETKTAQKRTEVARELLNKLPMGYRKGYLKTLRYNLFINHNLLMSEQQIASFFQNGYSSAANTILLALEEFVELIEIREKRFAEKLQSIT